MAQTLRTIFYKAGTVDADAFVEPTGLFSGRFEALIVHLSNTTKANHEHD
jgi:hypothetical protein